MLDDYYRLLLTNAIVNSTHLHSTPVFSKGDRNSMLNKTNQLSRISDAANLVNCLMIDHSVFLISLFAPYECKPFIDSNRSFKNRWLFFLLRLSRESQWKCSPLHFPLNPEETYLPAESDTFNCFQQPSITPMNYLQQLCEILCFVDYF